MTKATKTFSPLLYPARWDITDVAIDLSQRLIERTGTSCDQREVRKLVKRMHRVIARHMEAVGLADIDQISLALSLAQAKSKTKAKA